MSRSLSAARRRGAVVVKIAIFLPILLALCAYAINVCYLHLARAQLRAAADFSARAAASTFAATGQQADAQDAAVEIAGRHTVGVGSYTLDPANVSFGNSTQSTSTSRYTYDSAGTQENSVQVVAAANNAPLLFRGFLNDSAFSLQQSATATFRLVDICLVLDRSSSMKLPTSSTAGLMSTSDPRFCAPPLDDSRWAALTEAVGEFTTLIERTAADERVGMVTYASSYRGCDGTVSTDSDINVDLTGNMGDIRDEMETLNTTLWNGATNIDSGIAKGTTALLDRGRNRTNSKKVMILLTDGVFTGANPLANARLAAARGVTIHTITFSEGANQTDMQAVAAASGGQHFHAPDPATLNRVFKELAAMSVMLTD